MGGLSGTGFGHGGVVGEILDVLPTDSTWHITDCGIDDNDRCGCYDLPAKLRAIVNAAVAAALTEAADDVLTEFDPPIEACIWASEWLRDRAARMSSP